MNLNPFKHGIAIIFLLLTIFTMPAMAANATSFLNITATEQSVAAGTNMTYVLNLTNNGTDGADSYYVNITNTDSASTAAINISSPVALAQGATQFIALNVTNTAPGTFRVNITATSVNDSTKYGYVNTSLSVYDVPGIITFSPSATVYDTNAVISRTFSVTVNQSATVTYYLNGTNVGSAVGTTVNYTNTSAGLGTWNVTATATTAAGSASQTWIWIVPTSTISSLALTSNISTNDRVAMGANTSLNFTFSDTGNVTHINITFPATYNFSGVTASNISTSMGTCTVTLTSTLLSCYNATERNNTNHYINITGQLKTPPISATNTITVTTNKNTTGASITQYTRDITKPFYVSMNNSMFTIASESFGTNSETITLMGSGSANLTFYTQNISGQTNITVGFGASNVTVIRSRYTGTINGMSNMSTIYIETNPTVTNPVIVISAEGEFESSNLPAAITAAGVISGLTVIYAYLRRRRRH